MVNDIYQGGTGNTPLLEPRSYFGTVDRPRNRGMYSLTHFRITAANALLRLPVTPVQVKWIEKHAPDFDIWRDEFRNQYHFYVKRKLTDNQLMLAQLIFTFSEPSHYPVGDEANWVS